jgi:hypothetical protein
VTAPHLHDVVAGWEQLPAEYQHLDVADVAIDSRDRVYLLTRYESRVLVYEPNGEFVTAWGEDILSDRPHAITIASDNSAYCVDETQHCVHKFSLEGNLLFTIGNRGAASDTGVDDSIADLYERVATVTRPAPPFNRPTKVAVAPDGDLYISDGYGNARIHHFSADGELLSSWGEPGSGPGQFRVPHSVCVDSEYRLYVADRENDRVQIFGADGTYQAEWTDIHRPSGMCIDGAGFVYVTELPWYQGQRSFRHGRIERDRPGRITVFAANGEVAERFGDREPRCDNGNVSDPHGIAVDSNGALYVAEVIRSFSGGLGLVPDDCHTFQKFELRAGSAQ